jgi:hypothetical protein
MAGAARFAAASHCSGVNSGISLKSMTDDPSAETYSEAETEARREAALKRMLATPHKPHKSKDHRPAANGEGE